MRPAVAPGKDPSRRDASTKLGRRKSKLPTKGGCEMLWLAEAAIQGYFRDVLPAIPQVARGPFETHICEHFIWPDAGRSPKQASKMSRTQAHQSRNAFQRYVPGYTRFHKFHDLGNFILG